MLHKNFVIDEALDSVVAGLSESQKIGLRESIRIR
jgi:hypothetical protein